MEGPPRTHRNEVEDEGEVEVDEGERRWKRSGSATVAAADEPQASGPARDLTCELGGVGVITPHSTPPAAAHCPLRQPLRWQRHLPRAAASQSPACLPSLMRGRWLSHNTLASDVTAARASRGVLTWQRTREVTGD